MTEKRFEDFFEDERYLTIKNSLFNYRNRLVEVKKLFYKTINLDAQNQIFHSGMG